jgi:predicted GNAT family acetyltransferase
MRVRLIADPAEFLSAAGPLLLEDEARHNLILGLAATLRDHPGLYPDPRLWVVEDGGAVVGAALRTPPRGLVLAQPQTNGALDALAAAITDDLTEVVGGLPEAQVFAATWSAKTNSTDRVRTAQGIYGLSAVRAPADTRGMPRSADVADRPLLVDWWRAFAVEAMHEDEPDLGSIEQAVDHRLAAEGWGLVMWEDSGEPVSFAGFGGATPNGVRIGPVYTAPERRGSGYASALVASVSTDRLAEGKRFCFLYTDLANPTANRIYERVGYEWVCESAEIAFDAD